jgi:hypothetical protein
MLLIVWRKLNGMARKRNTCAFFFKPSATLLKHAGHTVEIISTYCSHTLTMLGKDCNAASAEKARNSTNTGYPVLVLFTFLLLLGPI